MSVLDGRAVVITGAGRGLGRASALHAAAHGAAVVVNDVDDGPADEVVSAIREAGGRAVPSVGSVADPDQAHAAVARCLTEFGRIDGLVNNAGVRYEAPVWEDPPDQARQLIEINVLGSLYCGAAAARAMRDQGSGSIVNMASLAMVGQPGAATYAASKGAVSSMTVAWAWDLRDHGVRVNGLFPLALTRMSGAGSGVRQTPGEVAPVVTYLLSDLSCAVTAQLIRYTGSKIHIVRQIGAMDPVLAVGGDLAQIAEAFDRHLVLDNPTRATVDPEPVTRGHHHGTPPAEPNR